MIPNPTEPVATEGEGVELPSPELQMLRINAKSGWYYRFRKKYDWDENYELYRDKVIINRLTQRQSVNLPIMKQTIKTLLKDVDEMPILYFENLDNNKEAELFKNEYWKYTVEVNRMELQDIVDKRQVFLFGRSFDQWQIMDGKVKMTVQDPMDMLVDRYVDPFNLHSARWLIHEHIFIPLADLDQNKDYDQLVVAQLKDFYAGTQGLLRSKDNMITYVEKYQKLADLGVPDVMHPILGETYVELSMHFIRRPKGEKWIDANTKKESTTTEEQIFLYVVADYMRILMKKPLELIIGLTKDHYWQSHYPYVTWADDVERQDFWSDGIGDIVRTPNKILNTFFSQMVENRTLRNYGMHYYNSSLEGFQPQTFVPIPWGWYGLPIPPNTDIKQVMQTVDVPSLEDSLNEMTFIMTEIEKATGATSTQQGVPDKKQVTLGEVQLMVGEAKERIKGMSKFYTPAWKERGMMFLKLIEAAPDKLDAVKIYKKGRSSTDVYTRTIGPKDWMTPSGYTVKIWDQEQKNSLDIDELNKLNAVKANMPDNPKLDEIYKRKLLMFVSLKPDEVNEVMRLEAEKTKMQAQGGANPQKESISIAYKDAPPDIKRQMEKAAGFTPSQMQDVNPDGSPVGPVTPGQPTPPTPGSPVPAGPTTSQPPVSPNNAPVRPMATA